METFAKRKRRKMINFLIISCGYKCKDTIQKCIDSVDGQSYNNWHHLITIDNVGYKDDIEFLEKRTFVGSAARKGKMFNFAKAMHMAHNLSSPCPRIVIDLDADDYVDADALEILAEIYKDPNVWATHGSYRMLSGRPSRFNGEYKTDNFRGQKFLGTHLKSFRAPLFYKIKTKDFKGRDGKWLMTASDMAIMFPVMELAGLDRIKYVPEVIYNYNDLSDLNDHKVDPEGQKRIEKIIRKRPRYKRLKEL